MVSFAVQKLFSLLQFHFLNFCFCCLGVLKFKKSSPRLMSRSLLPVFFQMFMVSFKSFIHFQFIFAYGVRKQSDSFTCGCPVFPIPFIEEDFFLPLCIVVFLCLRLMKHMNVSLFLGSLFCSIDLFLCQYHTGLITIALQYSLK